MRAYRSLALFSAILAFFVVGLGAYVRLSDAGLGCPDWPGCYGKLVGVPEAHHEQAAALSAFPGKPVEAHKAWKEMVHRYFAGTLGLCILGLCVLAWRHRQKISPWLPSLLVAVVAFQAALGMWTVTKLLKPVIVSTHLLGGMATLALLVWLNLRSASPPRSSRTPTSLRWWATLALICVIGQIALGGWVSSNYAALACPDLPTCQSQWWPHADFEAGFRLLRPLGEDGFGGYLGTDALTAIHLTHRLGAMLVCLVVGSLVWKLLRAGLLPWAALLGGVMLAQLSLGIANVLLALPLPVAVAHNLGAACLLASLVACKVRLARQG